MGEQFYKQKLSNTELQGLSTFICWISVDEGVVCPVEILHRSSAVRIDSDGT